MAAAAAEAEHKYTSDQVINLEQELNQPPFEAAVTGLSTSCGDTVVPNKILDTDTTITDDGMAQARNKSVPSDGEEQEGQPKLKRIREITLEPAERTTEASVGTKAAGKETGKEKATKGPAPTELPENWSSLAKVQ